MQDIYGKYDRRATKVECEYKINLLLLYYFEIEKALDIYKENRYTDRNNIYNLKLEQIKDQFCNLFMYFLPYRDTNIYSGEMLIQVFDILYADYEEFINFYFENYKTFGKSRPWLPR